MIKARTDGCVRNDRETHSTGVTGLHSRLCPSYNPVTQSRAFHCHFAHTHALSLYTTLFWPCDYLSMLGLTLNHVSKRATGTFHCGEMIKQCHVKCVFLKENQHVNPWLCEDLPWEMHIRWHNNIGHRHSIYWWGNTSRSGRDMRKFPAATICQAEKLLLSLETRSDDIDTKMSRYFTIYRRVMSSNLWNRFWNH